MANYVWHKVICNKATFTEYFIDYEPIEEGEVIDKPYITFNKMFGVKSISEYYEKVGEYIYYGDGFSYKALSKDRYEIKFTTMWKYPIEAIKKIIELANDTEWYAVEENYIYVSRFYWCDGVREGIIKIEEDYEEWREKNADLYESIEVCDNEMWYYLQTIDPEWTEWESDDGFGRYDKAIVDIYELLEMNNI